MLLERLAFTNFRNYRQLKLELPAGLILLCGANAQGKSNLLEAICYLALGRSLRTGSDGEAVNWEALDDPQPFARAWAQVENRGRRRELEVRVIGSRSGPDGELAWSKQVMIDRTRRPAGDLLGTLRVVLFRPQDLDLVEGVPSLRRRYLDVALCQLDAHYCMDLRQYNRVLFRRNRLLKQLRGRDAGEEVLAFWDQRLVALGAGLVGRREWALERINGLVGGVHASLTGGRETLSLAYYPNLGQASDASPEALLTELRQIREDEIRRGITLIGPHRDDFSFTVGGVDLRTFGSRGQQRTAALSLKLAELAFVRSETAEQPLLLLDDVMSELDAQRRDDIDGMLEGLAQVILTGADPRHFPSDLAARATAFTIQDGEVTPSRG